jgi:hypothetical protein
MLFAGGQLELESTCSSLIWGSVPSNSKSVQTFILRNRGAHKEKLLLNIEDNKNCFKVNHLLIKKTLYNIFIHFQVDIFW